MISGGIKQNTARCWGCPVMSVGSETCKCNEEVAVSNKIRELFTRKRRYYESAIRDGDGRGFDRSRVIQTRRRPAHCRA